VGMTLKEAEDGFKREFIAMNLEQTQGNRSKAAKILGIQRTYLSRLIPWGASPLLWLPIYIATAYACIVRRVRIRTTPLLICCLIYFLFMALTYYRPVVVRGASLLFPLLISVTGVALADVHRRVGRTSRAVLTTICLAIIAISGIWSAAYVSAMARTDPRTALHNRIAELTSSPVAPPRVAIFADQRNYYTVTPTLRMYPWDTFEIESGDAPEADRADMLIFAAIDRRDHQAASAKVRSIEQSGTWRLETIFQNQVTIVGWPIDLRNAPNDMQYPFPKIYLFRRDRH